MAEPPSVSTLKSGIKKNLTLDREDLADIGIDLDKDAISPEGIAAVNVVLEELFRDAAQGTSCYQLSQGVRQDLQGLVAHGVQPELSQRALAYDPEKECVRTVLKPADWSKRLATAKQLDPWPIWLVTVAPDQWPLRVVYLLKGQDPARIRWFLDTIEGQRVIWGNVDDVAGTQKALAVEKPQSFPYHPIDPLLTASRFRHGARPLAFVSERSRYIFSVEPAEDGFSMIMLTIAPGPFDLAIARDMVKRAEGVGRRLARSLNEVEHAASMDSDEWVKVGTELQRMQAERDEASDGYSSSKRLGALMLMGGLAFPSFVGIPVLLSIDENKDLQIGLGLGIMLTGLALTIAGVTILSNGPDIPHGTEMSELGRLQLWDRLLKREPE